jgi:hypothetical protein
VHNYATEFFCPVGGDGGLLCLVDCLCNIYIALQASCVFRDQYLSTRHMSKKLLM